MTGSVRRWSLSSQLQRNLTRLHHEKNDEPKYMLAGVLGLSYELAEEAEEIAEVFRDDVNGAGRFWPACGRIHSFKD